MEAVVGAAALSNRNRVEEGVEFGNVEVGTREIVGVIKDAGHRCYVEVSEGRPLMAVRCFDENLEPANDRVKAFAVPLECLSLRGELVWRNAIGLSMYDGGMLFEVFGDGHSAFGQVAFRLRRV